VDFLASWVGLFRYFDMLLKDFVRLRMLGDIEEIQCRVFKKMLDFRLSVKKKQHLQLSLDMRGALAQPVRATES